MRKLLEIAQPMYNIYTFEELKKLGECHARGVIGWHKEHREDVRLRFSTEDEAGDFFQILWNGFEWEDSEGDEKVLDRYQLEGKFLAIYFSQSDYYQVELKTPIIKQLLEIED